MKCGTRERGKIMERQIMSSIQHLSSRDSHFYLSIRVYLLSYVALIKFHKIHEMKSGSLWGRSELLERTMKFQYVSDDGSI